MFGSFDENARGYPVPMRGTIGRDWAYVFNAWSDGENAHKNDDMNHASFKELFRHAAADPAVKAQLKANTEEAVKRGVFGAPAFFVDSEMHFGQDRLDFVAEALRN